jgi:glycosyltransferase involved in cell wall biosynthesis
METASVVIPAFNAEATIGKALQSVFDQIVPVTEVVVVDDGSSDRTSDVVREWRDRLPLTLIRNDRNLGLGPTQRRGVAAASCEWVLRLDADDRWLPGHTRALAEVGRSSNVLLVTAPAFFVAADGARLGVTKPICDARIRRKLMWDNVLVHSATGYRKAAYLDVGGYGPYKRWEDYDLWVRLLSVGRLGCSDIPSVEYVVSGASLSRIKRSSSIMHRWDCQQDAIFRYWRRHPVTAACCLTLGGARAVVASVTSGAFAADGHSRSNSP